jgi:hypothetical protein
MDAQTRAPISFKFLRQLNQAPVHIQSYKGRSHAPLKTVAETYFTSDALLDKFIHRLAANEATSFKEILESCEFFGRVRDSLQSPDVADLCCGHGLVGILFALFERRVERVTLVDGRKPPGYDRVLASAVEVGPWVADKVTYIETGLDEVGDLLPQGASVCAVHACGNLSDRCLDIAIGAEAQVALMPCCHNHRYPQIAPVLYRELGVETAVDAERTNRLGDAGYHVNWRYVSERITPMNRILIGKRNVDITVF